MSEGKTRIPALEGTPEEIANYKEAFRLVHSSDWVKNSIPMDAAENSYLQEAADLEAQRWKCGARQRNMVPEVQDCDWPVCGCDPYASKVLDAIEESGFKIIRDEARGHQAPSATLAAHHGATGDDMTKPDPPLAQSKGKRSDLAIVLNAWKFWGELTPELQSELLDCIEHTYAR